MRWRPPTRPLILIALLLLAGAVVNVAVAWGIAAKTRVQRDPFFSERLGFGPAVALDEFVLDFLVEAWSAGYASGHGRVEGRLGAMWPSRTPEGWPADCLRLCWEDWGASWIVGLQGDGSDLFLIDSYQVGWPARTLGLLYQSGGAWPAEAEAKNGGLAAPPLLLRHGLFLGPAERLPIFPRWPGFAINTLFYAAILALPLSFFPIRRRFRARRGRCPKCGYDLAGLVSAEAEGGAPCPECGAAR